MLFSERQGYKSVKEAIQSESMDSDLRNSLWNGLQIFYFNNIKSSQRGMYVGYYINSRNNKEFYFLFATLWMNYFKKPIDSLPGSWKNIKKIIKDYYFECEWFEVYDFIEFIAKNYSDENINKEFIEYCNKILENEASAYRFVKGNLTKITSEEELNEIEEALMLPYESVKLHIDNSLKLLSDRKNPDYRNSIKESISAVESLCKNIVDDPSATLGQSLNKIDKHVDLHPALKLAFKKLYGYTNDKDGIRHSLMDKDTIDFEDAKYMIVSCSAFVNYVIAKLPDDDNL